MKLNKLVTAILASVAITALPAFAAKYQVVPLETPSQFKDAFPLDINNNEQVVAQLRGVNFNNYVSVALGRNFNVNATLTYDHPIDVTQLDFEDEELIDALTSDDLLFALTRDEQYRDVPIDYVDDVQAGNFTLESKLLVMYYLHSLADDTLSTVNRTTIHRQLDGRFHPIGQYWSALANGNQLTHVPLLDTVNPNTGQLSYEFNEHVKAVNDQGWLIGGTESPYQNFNFTDANGEIVSYHVQDYIERAFIKVGDNDAIILDPVDTTFRNGHSFAADISNSGYIVGSVSTQFQVLDEDQYDILQYLEDCAEANELAILPSAICLWQGRETFFDVARTYMDSRSRDNRTGRYEALSKTETSVHHAYRWLVNENGEVIEEKDLGVAFNEDADNDLFLTLYSQAVAVNEAGIAVGRSHVYTDDDEDFAVKFAAIFKDDEVITIVDDPDDVIESAATDINDNDIVIGYGNLRTSLTTANRAFYYDINRPEQGVVEIDSGLEVADTEALSINNNGDIVGVVDIISIVGSGGRRHGFIYNIETAVFEDLNNLITCDSGYTITKAEDINENGVILATATIPVDQKNIMGDPLLDPDTGEIIKSSDVIAVKLIPIEGEAENCFDEENKVERQGAGLGLWLLLTLGGLIYIKRR